jgi:uncharacterized protein YdeI (YjbR/CyaY-like superfamily)
MNKVDLYIQKKSSWKNELELLRKIMLQTGMEETVKWGIPTYTQGGKNVAGLGAFKNHVAIWFFNGVFLKDPEKVLVNAQEDKTKGLRQWRFKSIEEIPAQSVLKYALEAKANQEMGKEIKPEKRKIEAPKELEDALKSANLEASFDRLTPGKKKEYYEYISSAKRAQTKESRLEKILPLIKAGKGLNDKYK